MEPKRRRTEEQPQSSNSESSNSSSAQPVQSTTNGDTITTMKSTTSTSNSMFVLNVGGTLFYTSKQTLISGSNFFAAALTHFAEGTTDSSEEFYVDRDPEAFPMLLNYMRSGVLLCDADTKLLAAVVLEADFYSMDELLYQVKEQCYINLHQPTAKMTNKREIAKVLKEFPMARDLVRHDKFPQMYYEVIRQESNVINRIISSYALPANTFVEISIRQENKKCYYQAFEMATVEFGTGITATQPMILHNTRTRDWHLVDVDAVIFPYLSNSPLRSQIVPLEFLLRGQAISKWSIITKEFIHDNDNDCSVEEFKYTYRDEKTNKLCTSEPNFIEIRTYDDLKREVTGFGYNRANRLVDVSTFNNFVGMGDKHEHEEE